MKHRLKIHKFRRITSRLAGAFGLLLVLSMLLVSGATPAQADGPPPIPHRFFGDVTIDGNPANVKTVKAEIGGAEVQSQLTDTDGHYGYEGLPAFLIVGDANDEIYFYVDGILATEDPVLLVIGGVTRLDLAVSTPLAVQTNDATDVMPTTATLNGALISTGGAATVNVSFEWGLTAAYGNTTTPTPMTTAGIFSAGLTGLIPNTTYHYLAKAEGSTAYGEDKTFTTLAELAVETNAATAIGQTTATLNGALLTMGGSPNVNVSFEWGLTDAYGNTTAPAEAKTTTGPFSFVQAGLAAGTTYHYRAKAEGSTAYGEDKTFTTTAAPPALAVETNAATAVGQDTATLNGNLTNMGGAATVDVSFEWGLTDAYGNTTAPAEAKTTTGPYSFVLAGLTAGTTYHYRAKAEGSTAYGADMTFATAVGPGAPPAPILVAPANGALVSDSTINFQWNPVPTATKYWLTVKRLSDNAVFFSSAVFSTSTTVMGFPLDNTTYYWKVWAKNADGWSPSSASWTFTVQPGFAAPPPPSGLCPNIPGTSIKFNWNATPSATKYWISVKRQSDDALFYGSAVFNPSITILGFPNDGTTYYWKVWANNTSGWSPASNSECFVNGAP